MKKENFSFPELKLGEIKQRGDGPLRMDTGVLECTFCPIGVEVIM